MMKRPAFKKIFTYGLFPFLVLFIAFGPIGAEVAHAEINGVKDCFTKPLECSGTIVSAILVGLNGVLSLFLYLIGVALDAAIDFSINTDFYQSDAINIAWTLLRDIINISFIFILLYVAIGTILRIESINWKKHLTAIIIAALLVNFSLFLTKVVVDAGNILASSFYTTITECGDGNECKDVEGNSREEVGISERFMNALGIQKINDFRLEEVEDGWQGVRINLLKTIIILITLWVFLAAALLFVARTFALMFIFVLSPIGVAGANLPILSKYAQQWREELFKWTVLGAVFLFLIFVVLTFAYQAREQDTIDVSGFEVGDNSQEEFLPGDTKEGESAETLFIVYIFVIAGLFITLHITKSLSGKVGKMADNAGKAALGMSLGVATGGMALAGRRTIGTQASRLKENANLQARAEEGGARGISARMALGAADRFSKSSFDPRTTSLGKIATKNLEKQGLKNAGVSQNAGKGGVQKGIEEAEKAAVETSKQYQATPKEIEREKQRMLREAKQAEEESKNTIYASRREEKLKRAQQLRKEASEYGGKDITARRQEAFARRLEKQNWLKRNIRNRITLVGAGVTGEERIDKKRAAAVRKNLKKSKPEQLLEELSGHLKEDKGSDKEDEEE